MEREGFERQVRSRRLTAAALGMLLVLVTTVGLVEAWRDGPVVDEPVYVAAGVTALTRHDLRFNPQHPPLAKAVAALPVLATHLAIPAGRAWRQLHQHVYTATFTRAQIRDGRLRTVTFLSRLLPLAETLLSILVVFALARRLGGRAGGVLAAALWSLDPLVVGNGHLDAIDVPFALTVLLTAAALWRWLERSSTPRLALVGVAAGGAVCTRATGLLVAAAAVGVVAVKSRGARAPAVALGVGLATVWTVYLGLDWRYTVHHLDVVPQRYLDGLR